LGIAVYRTFGIGLGFNFDHTSALAPHEIPSTRRLQARAAKSALRRAQQIYNASAASKILDSISDVQERRVKAIELRAKAKVEMDTLAQRLSDLIPTDRALDDGTTQVQQYASPDYVRTSTNEYMIRPSYEHSAVIENLRRSVMKDEVDYLNPMKHSRNGTNSLGDEFIEEWEAQQQRSKLKAKNSTRGNDNDENVDDINQQRYLLA
jgi:hypothetical protein